MTGLNVEDLELMPDGRGTARVTGKRAKTNPSGRRTIAFDAITGNYLIHYMDAMQITAGPVCLSKKKTFSLKRLAIYSVVMRIVECADLTGVVRGCHDFRRAFATIRGLIHRNSPFWADMIRRQLGHKHYSQTAGYTLIEADDIREQIHTPLHTAAHTDDREVTKTDEATTKRYSLNKARLI